MNYQNIRTQLTTEDRRLTAVTEHLLAFGRFDANDQAQLDHIESRQGTIRRALRRIDDGTYGICEVCGQPIGAARLEAVKDCCRCITCASEKRWRSPSVGLGTRTSFAFSAG